MIGDFHRVAKSIVHPRSTVSGGNNTRTPSAFAKSWSRRVREQVHGRRVGQFRPVAGTPDSVNDGEALMVRAITAPLSTLAVTSCGPADGSAATGQFGCGRNGRSGQRDQIPRCQTTAIIQLRTRQNWPVASPRNRPPVAKCKRHEIADRNAQETFPKSFPDIYCRHSWPCAKRIHPRGAGTARCGRRTFQDHARVSLAAVAIKPDRSQRLGYSRH